jgi:hypothetical protein
MEVGAMNLNAARKAQQRTDQRLRNRMLRLASQVREVARVKEDQAKKIEAARVAGGAEYVPEAAEFLRQAAAKLNEWACGTEWLAESGLLASVAPSLPAVDLDRPLAAQGSREDGVSYARAAQAEDRRRERRGQGPGASEDAYRKALPRLKKRLYPGARKDQPGPLEKGEPLRELLDCQEKAVAHKAKAGPVRPKN